MIFGPSSMVSAIDEGSGSIGMMNDSDELVTDQPHELYIDKARVQRAALTWRHEARVADTETQPVVASALPARRK